MPNPYFQFKQFIINHDRCAMKVCTDACILGAWFAAKRLPYSKVLDIGSGSGLLMMMLAQQSPASIHGIEIDPPSYGQLQENITRSEWSGRLQAFNGDVRTFSFPVKYDFIISNPPFFENDLPSPGDNLNAAKHSTLLTLEDLVQVIDRNLTEEGSFGVLLPYHRLGYFTDLCRGNGFWLREQLLVRQTPAHAPFRAILHVDRHYRGVPEQRELVIQDGQHGYTQGFVELLKDYYLYL